MCVNFYKKIFFYVDRNRYGGYSTTTAKRTGIRRTPFITHKSGLFEQQSKCVLCYLVW